MFTCSHASGETGCHPQDGGTEQTDQLELKEDAGTAHTVSAHKCAFPVASMQTLEKIPGE